MQQNKYKILIVVGARPQIMKAAALTRALDQFPEVQYEIIHSGQHYDNKLSDLFFEEFQLKAPLINLEIGSEKHNIFIAKFLLGFDPILEKLNPDMVVVVGDTNTTAAAAIATAKRNISIAHVEAGLREWDKKIPEEVNKLITDSISDLYFCPTQTAVENLVRQGINKKVYITGDITLDLLNDASLLLSSTKIKEKFNLKGEYILVTCHRESNTDNVENLREIVQGLLNLNYDIIWPLHPRTKKALELNNLYLQIRHKIKLIEPIGYSDTQSLIKHAAFVITDSGGIIKESYFHKTPGIIIDTQTEWVETLREGWNVIAGPNAESIYQNIKRYKRPTVHKNVLGDGQAGIRIAEKMIDYIRQIKVVK